jgi:hypothetical protein
MRKSNRFRILGLLAFSVPLARAADWDTEKTELGKNCSSLFSGFAGVGSCAGFLFNSGKPLRLMIPQSVVPGGGTALGLLYTKQLSITDWSESNFTMDAGSSLREFWFSDAVLTLSHRKWYGHWSGEGDRFLIQVYSHARGLPLMPFYGIGPNTVRSNLTDFAEKDFSGGASIKSPLLPWLNSGAGFEYFKPQVGAPSGTSVVSIDSHYAEATAPGLAHQPGFAHYEVSLRPGYQLKWTKFRSEIGYHRYQDLGSGHYSFHKFRTDVLQTIYPESQREPTGGGNGQFRRQPKYDSVLYIAGRFSSSWAASGQAIPFYLQETLGGSDIDNVATLRGFQDYRFRAPDLVSLQVQYERRLLPAPPAGSARPSTLRSVAGALGILAFYDTGQVATALGDLSFAHFRQSFGFGLTFWSGEKVWFRAYIGLGSGEGSHTFVGVTNPSASDPHL